MTREKSKTWNVETSKQVKKELKSLLKGKSKIYALVATLLKDIEINGPWRSNWPHYGPLKGKEDVYHCHLNKGKPTYVACWRIEDKKIKLVELWYVGTHEKAPY